MALSLGLEKGRVGDIKLLAPLRSHSLHDTAEKVVAVKTGARVKVSKAIKTRESELISN